MKLDQFQQLVLYCLACLMSKPFPHVNSYIMRCISNAEISGNIKENIYTEKEFLEKLGSSKE